MPTNVINMYNLYDMILKYIRLIFLSFSCLERHGECRERDREREKFDKLHKRTL